MEAIESELTVVLRVLDGLSRRGALRLLDASMQQDPLAKAPLTATLPADARYLAYVKQLEGRHRDRTPDRAADAPAGGSDDA